LHAYIASGGIKIFAASHKNFYAMVDEMIGEKVFIKNFSFFFWRKKMSGVRFFLRQVV
jgi:hypothetical protein